VGVKANVVDVTTGSEQTTNDFRFTWAQEDGKGSAVPRKVVPRTYQGQHLITHTSVKWSLMIHIFFRSDVMA
jgi:hypothetical protein